MLDFFSIGKKPLIKTTIILTFITVFCGIYEVVLRLKGVRPFQPSIYNVIYEPEFIFSPSLKYGYSLKPGKFKFTLPFLDSLIFKPTHTNDSVRKSHPSDPVGNIGSLVLFGASYTYGFGVEDSATFSWQLQNKLPGLNVINRGVPGYGPIHAYIRLMDLIEQNKVPKAVILNYSFYHDNTNTLPRKSRETIIRFSNISNKEFIQNAQAPYVKFNQEGKMEIQYQKYDSFYTEWPFRRYSALVNFLENKYNDWDENRSDSQIATKRIISAIHELCSNENILFVVAGISDHEATREILSYCQSKGIQNIDISVNLDQNGIYRLHVRDGHPNARAHTAYANKLYNYLIQSKNNTF